jgi:hypothetical protein
MTFAPGGFHCIRHLFSCFVPFAGELYFFKLCRDEDAVINHSVKLGTLRFHITAVTRSAVYNCYGCFRQRREQLSILLFAIVIQPFIAVPRPREICTDKYTHHRADYQSDCLPGVRLQHGDGIVRLSKSANHNNKMKHTYSADLLDCVKELGFTFSQLGISVLDLADLAEVRRAIQKRLDDEFERGMDKILNSIKEA